MPNWKLKRAQLWSFKSRLIERSDWLWWIQNSYKLKWKWIVDTFLLSKQKKSSTVVWKIIKNVSFEFSWHTIFFWIFVPNMVEIAKKCLLWIFMPYIILQIFEFSRQKCLIWILTLFIILQIFEFSRQKWFKFQMYSPKNVSFEFSRQKMVQIVPFKSPKNVSIWIFVRIIFAIFEFSRQKWNKLQRNVHFSFLLFLFWARKC